MKRREKTTFLISSKQQTTATNNSPPPSSHVAIYILSHSNTNKQVTLSQPLHVLCLLKNFVIPHALPRSSENLNSTLTVVSLFPPLLVHNQLLPTMSSARAPSTGAPDRMSAMAAADDSYHFSFKCVVLGDPGVGKTTLLEGEGGIRDSPITSSKIGVNFFRKYYSYQNQTYRIEYWDCPGASRYVSLARHFAAGAAAALILFDKNNRTSFESVTTTWLRAIESSCTSVIPVLVGTTTGYTSPKKQGRSGGNAMNTGGIMGLDDDYTEQFGLGGGRGSSSSSVDDANQPVSDEEARQFAKRYGLEYVNADPLARGEPDFATPSGVFEFVFSSIVGALPRLAEPSLLLQRGVKLGSLLLGDRAYQQKLYSSANRTTTKLPVSSKKKGKKKGRGGGGGGGGGGASRVNLPKPKKPSLLTGDLHLDQEGEVPDRTDRQIREMEGDQPPPPSSAANDESNPLAPSKSVVGYLVKNKSQVVTHYMQSKSWHSTARRSRPAHATDRSKEPLTHCLSLEHVHGFRGQDSRNNLYYAKDGSVVYIAAALAIAVDPKTGRQRYMSGHTDDIISIALSNQVKKRGAFSIFATGEVGRRPKILVWESHTMRVLNTLKGAHQRGVAQLAFSPDGLTLASVGLDDQNSLALHDWKAGTVLVRVRTGGDKVFGLKFQPGDSSNVMDDTRLVTCGCRHMTFWKRNGKSQITSKGARFGKDLAGNISVIDVCFDIADRTIAGTSLGHLCVWSPNGNSSPAMSPLGSGSIKNAHKGPINSVESVPGGEKFVSGGVDGKIRVWNCPQSADKKIEALKTLDMFQQQTLHPSVQSLSISSNKARALVGTRGGDIMEIKLNDGSLLKPKPLTSGHHHGELWGLAAHPVDPLVFATSGDDKTVRLWNIRRRECMAMTESEALPTMSRALVFTPRGENLVVGLGGRLGHRKVGQHGKHAGKVVVLDSTNLSVLSTTKVAKEMISDMCFTPDGQTLAVASHDNIIYLLTYRSPTDLQPRARCRGHSSYVTNISVS